MKDAKLEKLLQMIHMETNEFVKASLNKIVVNKQKTVVITLIKHFAYYKI